MGIGRSLMFTLLYLTSLMFALPPPAIFLSDVCMYVALMIFMRQDGDKEGVKGQTHRPQAWKATKTFDLFAKKTKKKPFGRYHRCTYMYNT